jgi:hypothetical protein
MRPKEKASNPLIGLYFHTFQVEDETTLIYQGRVLANVTESMFLVETFSFLTGEGGRRSLVTLDQMHAEHWRFYITREEWHEAYADYDQHKRAERAEAVYRKERL